MKNILGIATNKYFLASIIFIVWMIFFDQRDFFYVKEQKSKLKTLQQKCSYFKKEIEKANKELVDLQNNSTAQEKFAREKYLMKKTGEDIYLIEDSLNPKN